MVATKEKHDNNYLTLDHFINGGAPKISNPEVQKKQEGGKYITAAQELGKIYDDYIRFTSSPEEFKKALKEKFGDINQFNQYLILSALILEYLKKAAEEDEGLKKLLSSLQEKRDAINKNMEKIAKELGYTVSSYSLDKLKGKDLNGVKETLARDFGVEPKLEVLFSSEALNSLTDLFAFMVNKYPISSVNAPVAAVPIMSDKNDKTEDNAKQKSAEEKAKKEHQQVVLQQQQAEQVVVKQSPEEKQNKEYHSPLRGTGKKIAIAGLVLGVLGGVLFAGSFFYLPMAAFGLSGIGLAALGLPLVFVGGFTWTAGLISEAIHNHHVQKAQDEEEKRKKALEKEEKKRKKALEKNKLNYDSWKYKNEVKDGEALKKQLTNQVWLEKHINAKTEAEHKKRVEEAKKEIEKIMEEEKKQKKRKRRKRRKAKKKEKKKKRLRKNKKERIRKKQMSKRWKKAIKR